eukprot:2930930-Prorocentrum_lima.AAC.1
MPPSSRLRPVASPVGCSSYNDTGMPYVCVVTGGKWCATELAPGGSAWAGSTTSSIQPSTLWRLAPG